MSAWADMQEDWTNNNEDKFMSGILLCDPIGDCLTLQSAKAEIKKYVKTLPV